MTLSVPVATAVNTMNAAAQCAKSTVTPRDMKWEEYQKHFLPYLSDYDKVKSRRKDEGYFWRIPS